MGEAEETAPMLQQWEILQLFSLR